MGRNLRNSPDISIEDIEEFTQRVFASGVLGRSERRTRLLEHIIRSELLGQGDKLKAYSIGLDIFEKSAEFDPSSDSVVRVEMGRLRNSIALFEASAFADTRIMVDIPVGTYRPNVRLRPTHESTVQDTATPPKRLRDWTWTRVGIGLVSMLLIVAAFIGLGPKDARTHSVLIGVQFRNNPGSDTASRNLRTYLKHALTSSDIITVLEPLPGDRFNENARFVVSSNVVSSGTKDRAILELTDITTGHVLWTLTKEIEEDADVANAVEDELAAELRRQLFQASKEVLASCDPNDLPPSALFVLATSIPGYSRTSIEWQESRLALAQLAVQKDPNYGPAHSLIADKLVLLSNLSASADSPDIHEKARWHADRAIELAPNSADTTYYVAQYMAQSGRRQESQLMLQRTLELDPSRSFARLLEIIVPYACQPAPDDVVQRALALEVQMVDSNPLRGWVLGAIGILHVSREE